MSGQPMAVIIEDDPDVRELIVTVLQQSGFTAHATSNGYDGLEAIRLHDPVVTTLDVSMPGMDGFATARRIREFSSTYLIMLTALGDEIDVVQGLDAGADDYIVKPFRPRELRARIASLQRRPQRRSDVPGQEPAAPAAPAPALHEPPAATIAPAAASAAPVDALSAPLPSEPAAPPASASAPPYDPGPRHAEPVAQTAPAPGPASAAPVAGRRVRRTDGLNVDSAARTASVDGTPIDLTRTEFDLLAALVESGRRVRTKADLVLMLRGESYVTTYYVTEADKRAVSVHMANLRRKMGDNSTTPRWIETVRGVGYRMAVTD